METNIEDVTKYSEACQLLEYQHLTFLGLPEKSVYQKLEEVGMFWDIRIDQWYMKDLEKGQKVTSECKNEATQLILAIGWTSNMVDKVLFERYGCFSLSPVQWIDFRDYLKQVKTHSSRRTMNESLVF